MHLVRSGQLCYGFPITLYLPSTNRSTRDERTILAVYSSTLLYLLGRRPKCKFASTPFFQADMLHLRLTIVLSATFRGTSAVRLTPLAACALAAPRPALSTVVCLSVCYSTAPYDIIYCSCSTIPYCRLKHNNCESAMDVTRCAFS
jgi:hypothetical protein